jgi:uncharacterized membrane protein YgcG
VITPLRILAAVGALLCSWLTDGARASSPSIRDEARLFSPAARREADAQIASIRNDYRVHVRIDTYPAVSWFARLTRDFQDLKTRNRYFTEWARRNAQSVGPDGIYVLVCKDPDPIHVEVITGRGVLPYFPANENDRLRTLLLGRFRQGQYDSGLSEALQAIQAALEHNGAVAAEHEPSFSWPLIGGICVAFLALWGGLELVRYFTMDTSHETSGSGEPTGYGGGGSLPAGLFVTMTKPWHLTLLGPDQHRLDSLEKKTVAVVDPQSPTGGVDHRAQELAVDSTKFAGGHLDGPVAEHEVAGDAQP